MGAEFRGWKVRLPAKAKSGVVSCVKAPTLRIYRKWATRDKLGLRRRERYHHAQTGWKSDLGSAGARRFEAGCVSGVGAGWRRHRDAKPKVMRTPGLRGPSGTGFLARSCGVLGFRVHRFRPVGKGIGPEAIGGKWDLRTGDWGCASSIATTPSTSRIGTWTFLSAPVRASNRGGRECPTPLGFHQRHPAGMNENSPYGDFPIRAILGLSLGDHTRVPA